MRSAPLGMGSWTLRTLLAKLLTSETLRYPANDMRGITDVNKNTAAAAVCLQCGRAVFLLSVFRLEIFRSYFASSGSSTPSFSAWAVRTARAP